MGFIPGWLPAARYVPAVVNALKLVVTFRTVGSSYRFTVLACLVMRSGAEIGTASLACDVALTVSFVLDSASICKSVHRRSRSARTLVIALL